MSANKTSAPNQRGLIAELKLLPKPFYLLVAGTFISHFGHFVIPFLTIYISQLGFAPSVIGLALGAYGVGGFCACILGGYLADKIGRKPTLLISCVGAACAMLLLSAAKTPLTIILGTYLCGLMSSLFYPASSSLVADLVPAHLRIRAYAVQRFSGNLAFALGMTTAGIVAGHSFKWLFIVDALTTLILAVIIFFGLARGIGKKAESQAGWSPALKSIISNHAFLRTFAASFLVALVFMQLSSSFGLQVTEKSGFSEKTFGYLLGLNGMMIVTLELPLTSWTKRHHPQAMMALGHSLLGLGLGLLFFGQSLPMLLCCIVILTLGEMIASPISSNYVAQLAPDDMRGRYMGFFGFHWSLATALGPMIGLWIFAQNSGALWMLCGLAGLVAAWIILINPSRKK